MKNRVLAINPGSTSTKIAVYDGDTKVFVKNIHHSNEELAPYEKIVDQFPLRKQAILKALAEEGVELSSLNVIVGRGGLIHPVESGVYEVNDRMKADLANSPIGHHASNLGGLIADDLAKELTGVKAYIADPVVVDEMLPVARMTGCPSMERTSIFHALNQKAVGRAYAEKIGTQYEKLNLIVAHLGGGISIGAHEQGKVIDVNNALDGEGPFTPERSGTLPAGALVDLCFSGEMTQAEVRKIIKGEGGLVALLGSNDALAAENRALAGDQLAIDVLDAMSYNVGKSIGAMAAVLKGKVDAILITGGMAYSPIMVKYMEEMVKFIAPVVIYPGEDEMKALAQNGVRVLEGKVTPRVYVGK